MCLPSVSFDAPLQCHQLRRELKDSPKIRASASFGPSSTARRFFISFAALLVNVTDVISIGL